MCGDIEVVEENSPVTKFDICPVVTMVSMHTNICNLLCALQYACPNQTILLRAIWYIILSFIHKSIIRSFSKCLLNQEVEMKSESVRQGPPSARYTVYEMEGWVGNYRFVNK